MDISSTLGRTAHPTLRRTVNGSRDEHVSTHWSICSACREEISWKTRLNRPHEAPTNKDDR